MHHAYEQHFPFSTIRQEQKNAIQFALDAFLEQGKRFVVLEMGTGCGKSATGITIARYLQALHESGNKSVATGGSYIITTQKVLQEQYVRDFGNDRGILKPIRSASSYTCQFFEQHEYDVSCAEIRRLLKSKAKCNFIYEACNTTCKFQKAREEFVQGVEGITNYAYFLTSTTYTYEMERRGLIVIDEGHNIESALSNFVRIAFSNFFYKHVLNVKTPGINASSATVFRWLIETCSPKLRRVIRERKKLQIDASDSQEAITAARELEQLERNLKKIEHFAQVYDPSTWVLDVSKSDKRGERIYEFKPVDVTQYARDLLFSQTDRVLILSATILDRDVFCASVGIPLDQVAYLRIPSPFPISNRPVHFVPAGSMSKANIDNTLPVLAEVVKMLLDQHPNEKGIIHCGTYRIAKYLFENVGNKRLLTHTSDDRDAVIKTHYSSELPTVLLSPSMMEGVDLADDLSRFQILCKIPFPYLGDTAVLKQMERNKDWYGYQTVKSVVQSLGRSIRNETDHAISYILDSDWKRFYMNNARMFPEEFALSLS